MLLCVTIICAVFVAFSGCTTTSPSATPTAEATATAVANASATPTVSPNATAAPSTTPITNGSAPNFTTIQAGVLLVPVDSSFPPMEWLDMNQTDAQKQFTGFDMDLMRAIGEKLNVTPQFTTHSFDTIINDVQTHKYDCSISSFSITGERQQQVLFSNPYFQVQQTIVVRANDDSIQNATDLVSKGKVVAVQRGTTGAATAANLTDAQGNKISTANIKQFDTAEEAYQDLKKGTSDAVINDIEVNAYEVQMYPGDYKFTGTKFPTLEPYGIVIAKDNPQLAAAINWALGQLQADGTMDQLKQKYNLE